MRSLNFTNKALEFLRALQAKQFKQVAVNILELAQNPKPHDSKDLKGYSGLFRKDSGEYRIVYRFDDTTVYIMLVGKRNDDEIYKQLERLV